MGNSTSSPDLIEKAPARMTHQNTPNSKLKSIYFVFTLVCTIFATALVPFCRPKLLLLLKMHQLSTYFNTIFQNYGFDNTKML